MLDSAPVKLAALTAGFDVVGVCDPDPSAAMPFYREWLAAGFGGEMNYLAAHTLPKDDPNLVLNGVRSVVACAAFYGGVAPAPGIARYARGRDYHRVLARRLRPVAAAIEALAPGCRTRICVDSAPTLDRYWAHRAGLGWFGKNTMLINSARGSYFFIAVVLTDALIARDAPSHGACGTCQRCVDLCPTGAIVKKGERYAVDSRLCISYRTIEERGEDETVATHGWLYGCDICQEVCPFNATRLTQPLRNSPGQMAEFYESRPWPSAADAAEMTEVEWDHLTRGSAARRASARMWRRNGRRALQTRSNKIAVASPPPMHGLATA